jgi:ribosomal protein S8
LNLLVDQGCFRYYSIIYKLLKCGITWLSVKVFLIYIAGSDSLIKEFILVSKVSKRVYWTLDILFMNFSKRAFSGFYIISTSKGLCSSAELIWRIPLMGKMSGEILLKVSF